MRLLEPEGMVPRALASSSAFPSATRLVSTNFFFLHQRLTLKIITSLSTLFRRCTDFSQESEKHWLSEMFTEEGTKKIH